MNKELLNKVRVIRTTGPNRDKFEFPKEGWFVGALNDFMDRGSFRYVYLYNPKWSNHTRCSWGGYTDEIRGSWWTFNYCYGGIDTDYLYICEDKETAKELCDFLNTIPSKNVHLLEYDILEKKNEIERIKEKIAELDSYKSITEEILNKVEG